MPMRVEPCLALNRLRPPEGADWLYEVKWDGYRIALHIEPSGTRILTKGGHDWTARFPAVAESAARLGVSRAIIDGEALMLDSEGKPDFGALQKALGGGRGKSKADQAVMLAFDLLYFDGHDIRSMELTSRRHLLETLIGGGDGAIQFSEELDGDGRSVFGASCEHGLEGIVAKRRDSSYRSGRLGDWVKVKCIQSESFFVVGYVPSTSGFGGIGSLILAARRATGLVHVGSVGTGIKEREAHALRKSLDRIKTKKPPVDYEGKRSVVWAQPTLIAEIEFRAWTEDGKLRHAAYKGLRDVQDDASVYVIDAGFIAEAQGRD
jgi:bifunctional non-homologous end joining protein LigD